MFEVATIEFIRKQHFKEGRSVREIARQFHVSRQTVRKALKDSGPWKYTLREAKPCPVMGKYRDKIISWLEEDRTAPRKQRHTAKRIYDRLCAECGFRGSDSTVRRFVAKLRREVETPDIEPFFVLRADPGEMAQIDWGEAKVIMGGAQETVHLFCLRLRYSKVAFVWASPHERIEAFLEAHVRAFEWLRGVPEKLIYDNLATTVRKMLRGHERDLCDRFVGLRSHYLFESVFCNPAAAHEKGSVENLVGYVRRNALTPVPEVDSMEELNALLLAWCEKDRTKRGDDWVIEQARLRPIPEGTFRPCTTKLLTVNKFSLVVYDRNRYSVPTELIGLNVQVDAYTDRVEIFYRDKAVAVHKREYGRNKNSLLLEHYLSALARKPYAVTHAAVVRELPEPFQEARRLLNRFDPSGYRELVKILLLHREFTPETVREGVKKAIASGHLSAEDIRQDLLRHPVSGTAPGVTVPVPIASVKVAVGDPRSYDELLGVSA